MVLTLGLGIGANTTIFSAISAYLLRPLPSVESIDRLVRIDNRREGRTWSPSYPDFQDWQSESDSIDGITAYYYFDPVLTLRGDPEMLEGARVSAGFFKVFEVEPALGRLFLAEEERTGGEPVVLISHGFWQRRFGGSANVIRETLTLDGVSYQIVGVMPKGFRFNWPDVDLWTPLEPEAPNMPRERHILTVIARRQPGVSLEATQVEMNGIAGRLALAYPATNESLDIRVRDFVSTLEPGSGPGGPRETMFILMGVVVFVLLIACANVANLQLARATSRISEIAVRVGMGASRWRIIRQMLTESVLAAALGLVAGLGFSYAGLRLLTAVLPPDNLPLGGQLPLDLPVLVFTAAIAVAAGLLSGLAPAFQVSRISVDQALRAGGRGAATNAAGSRIRSSFVVAEVTLAVVLLLGASLLLRSFTNRTSLDEGFRIDNLLTAYIPMPNVREPDMDRRSILFHELVERLHNSTGIQAAAASTALPIGGWGWYREFDVEGESSTAEGYGGSLKIITPGYFDTVSVSLLRGRVFTERDTASSQGVVILGERLARQIFPDRDPVGAQIRWHSNDSSIAPWMTVVGVVAEEPSFGTTSDPTPALYVPARQNPNASMYLVIRSRADDPYSAVGTLRATLDELDRYQPITRVLSMPVVLSDALLVPRLMAALTGIFALIALLMAAMGIYGVISYSVGRRTQEFGIRMALGAAGSRVAFLVLRQALWLVFIGIAIGVPAALAATRLLRAYLFGVGVNDPLTFVTVPLLLMAVALAASYVPSRRATLVDPVIALKYE